MPGVQRKLIFGPARSSYMYVNSLEKRGKKITADTPKTISCGVLIPKKNKSLVRQITGAIDAVQKEAFNGKMVYELGDKDYPLRDVTKENKRGKLPAGLEFILDLDDDYYYMSMKEYKIPGLVNEDNERIEDPDEREEMICSGFHYKYSVVFKSYDNEDKGVAVRLKNLMFVKEDERFDGGVSAENEDWDVEEKRPRRRDRGSRRRSRR